MLEYKQLFRTFAMDMVNLPCPLRNGYDKFAETLAVWQRETNLQTFKI